MPEKLTLETYVVAYLDLLGSTERIEGDGDDRSLNAVKDIYDNLDSAFESLHINNNDFAKGDCHFRIFSDNIIIAKKVRCPNTDESTVITDLKEVFALASHFQYYALAKYNWPLRGGITLGDFYIDNMFVWGRALIESYNIESKASYPRIVLSNVVTNMLEESKNINNIIDDIIAEIETAYIKRDSEGTQFLHYLWNTLYLYSKSFPFINRKEIQGNLKGFKENVENALSEKKDGVFEKYQWIAKYHNSTYEELGISDYTINIPDMS